MKILEFVSESNGKLSSGRLIVVTWSLGVFAVWGYASYVLGSLATIPESVIVMFGTAIGGKVVQKFGERKDPVKTIEE